MMRFGRRGVWVYGSHRGSWSPVHERATASPSSSNNVPSVTDEDSTARESVVKEIRSANRASVVTATARTASLQHTRSAHTGIYKRTEHGTSRYLPTRTRWESDSFAISSVRILDLVCHTPPALPIAVDTCAIRIPSFPRLAPGEILSLLLSPSHRQAQGGRARLVTRTARRGGRVGVRYGGGWMRAASATDLMADGMARGALFLFLYIAGRLAGRWAWVGGGAGS